MKGWGMIAMLALLAGSAAARDAPVIEHPVWRTFPEDMAKTQGARTGRLVHVIYRIVRA